jgi:hypothetical protein
MLSQPSTESLLLRWGQWPHHLDKAPRLNDCTVAPSVHAHRRALGAQGLTDQRLPRLVGHASSPLRLGTPRREPGAHHHRPPIKADRTRARGTALLQRPAAPLPLRIVRRVLGALCIVAYDPRRVPLQRRRHHDARGGPLWRRLPAAPHPNVQGDRTRCPPRRNAARAARPSVSPRRSTHPARSLKRPPRGSSRGEASVSPGPDGPPATARPPPAGGPRPPRARRPGGRGLRPRRHPRDA